MRRFILPALLLATSACADIPRDPQRTQALVRETGTIRLGVVQGAPQSAEASQVLGKVAAAAHARAEPRSGDTETLLTDLKDGKIDLVYGAFADDSPWSKEVHFSSAPGWRATPPKTEKVARFAMRNGENGWIMLVERAIQP